MDNFDINELWHLLGQLEYRVQKHRDGAKVIESINHLQGLISILLDTVHIKEVMDISDILYGKVQNDTY